jgi:hypothetical protein
MTRTPAARVSALPGARRQMLRVLSLASVQPRWSTAVAIDAIHALGAEIASDALGRSRCRSIILPRLREHTDLPVVAATIGAIAARAAKIREMHRVLPANMTTVSNVARSVGLPIWSIKGLAARSMYPDPSQRDFGDLDLFVADRQAASAFARVFQRDLGYRINNEELPWLKYDDKEPLLYGQINLLAPEDTELLNVDFHFGDYSVRYNARLGLQGWPSHSREWTGREPGLHELDRTLNLACVVNNAAGDHFVTGKDINDFLMAASSPDVNWDLFKQIVQRASLGGFVQHIVRKAQAVSTMTDAQQDVFDRLSIRQRRAPRPPAAAPSWRKRTIGTVLHAYDVGRPAGRRTALRMAAGAYRYYRRPLRLRAVDRLSGSAEVPLNSWTCVRLVPLPLAEELAGQGGAADPARVTAGTRVPSDPAVVWIASNRGTYVVIDDDLFVATVHYEVPRPLIHEESVSAARAHV